MVRSVASLRLRSSSEASDSVNRLTSDDAGDGMNGSANGFRPSGVEEGLTAGMRGVAAASSSVHEMHAMSNHSGECGGDIA